MINVNEKAKGFELQDRYGETRSLAEFSGKKVVLYFYSKDNTSGCTCQAQGYAALFEKFKEKNAVVIGVSRDTVQSHAKFAEKYSLPFILLSDPSLEVIKAYGAWGEKKLYGKTSFGTVRTTYVIDENGTVVSARAKVKAADDPAQTLALL